MNEIDEVYTEEVLERSGGAYYDWERQYIQLQCGVEDVDVVTSKKTLTPKGLKYASVLVHEYIHFLQNFATNWGAPVYIDIAIAYLKIGSSSSLNAEIYKLPFDHSRITNTTLKDGLNLRQQVINRLGKSDSITPNQLATNQPFNVGFTNDIVTLSNGRVDVQVGMKVIRENMAHIGTHLYLGKSDDELHKYNGEISNDDFGILSYSKKAEYWAVFEYFYQHGSFTNISLGVFTLMQCSLGTLNPDKFVYRFFRYLRSEEFSGDLVDIIRAFIESPTEKQIFTKAFALSKSHCLNALELCKKHKEVHDLFAFIHDIIQYSINNICSNEGGRKLFQSGDPFNDFDYWRAKMFHYGTGIINFLNGSRISGSKEHCEKMEQNFKNFLSCGLVLKKLLGNKVRECPFLYDIQICKASKYDSDGCIINPFLVTSDNPHEGECLFRNGYLLLGMQDRIDFSS